MKKCVLFYAVALTISSFAIGCSWDGGPSWCRSGSLFQRRNHNTAMDKVYLQTSNTTPIVSGVHSGEIIAGGYGGGCCAPCEPACCAPCEPVCNPCEPACPNPCDMSCTGGIVSGGITTPHVVN